MLLPRCCLALSLLFHPGSVLLGNDGAAEVALGGIRLRQEHRVAMVKERLFISKKKVRVEYEFLNESKKDVGTEVAFPIPEYGWGMMGWEPFDAFQVWVNGATCPFRCEARAFVGAKEVTSTLLGLGLRIETLGDFIEGTGNTRLDEGKGGKPSTSQMEKLPKEQLESLIALGAVDSDVSDYRFRHIPRWTVKKTYHWTQEFLPGAIVRVAHEYVPARGSATTLSFDEMEHPRRSDGGYQHNQGAESGCVDAALKRAMLKAIETRNRLKPEDAEWRKETFPACWVRYILTTANTWQIPIRDFELVVERDPGELITFCWDGPVEKTGVNTFLARKKDFIPSKELTVYFLQP